jgi:ubiquinone/menaquinone biosynthesis C-methylase UbiE
MQILEHVLKVDRPDARVLEVGMGDGENLAFLPPSWDVYGVDVARTQLVACQNRHPRSRGRLAWSEGEAVPFGDEAFDACYTIGGFSYFNDHAAALREMRRVTKQGGPVVVADETPGMHRWGIGHLLGVPAVDGWWLRKIGLDRAFVDMVLHSDVDPRGVAEATWPVATRHTIWNRLGYCLVHPGEESTR